MGEAIEYIFGNLRACENDIKTINKTLKHQKRVNAKVTILALGCALYIAWLENQRKEEKAHMEVLNEELDSIRKRMTVHDLKFKEVDTQKGEAIM